MQEVISPASSLPQMPQQPMLGQAEAKIPEIHKGLPHW